MIMINLLTNHRITLLPKIMSQVHVITKIILMKNQDINMENQKLFFIFYIRVQKQTFLGHMLVLQMFQIKSCLQ